MEKLKSEDWQDIESYFAAVDDPLFGRVVGKQHRLLYEYLVHPMDKASRKFTESGISSLERLTLRGDALEQGVSQVCARVKKLGAALSGETRSTVAEALKPESLLRAVFLPAKYSTFLGKSLLTCSVDVMRICAATARNTLAAGKETS